MCGQNTRTFVPPPEQAIQSTSMVEAKVKWYEHVDGKFIAILCCAEKAAARMATMAVENNFWNIL